MKCAGGTEIEKTCIEILKWEKSECNWLMQNIFSAQVILLRAKLIQTTLHQLSTFSAIIKGVELLQTDALHPFLQMFFQ